MHGVGAADRLHAGFGKANQLGYARYSTYVTPGRPAAPTRSSRSSAPKPGATRTTATSGSHPVETTIRTTDRA